MCCKVPYAMVMLRITAGSHNSRDDERALQRIYQRWGCLQEFPGSHSQPVNASDAEAIIDTIVSANLASLKQISVPRSRKGYAVHECRKCLGSDGKLNPRRLIVLALLLCPGEPHVKYEKLLMLVPPAEEVRSGMIESILTVALLLCHAIAPAHIFPPTPCTGGGCGNMVLTECFHP